MRKAPRYLRLLLGLFPRDFRRRHGVGLEADHLSRIAEARGLRRWGVWMGVTGDVLGAVCGVWWDRVKAEFKGVEREGSRVKGNRLESLVADLRYAVRGLARTPGFTAMAVLTLALGLGANAAIFSVLNGVLLRPLPYDEPDELTRVWGRFLPESGFDFPYFAVDPTEYLDVRDDARSFESLAAYGFIGAALSGGDDLAERRLGLTTTWSLFDVLGVDAALGRTLIPSDDVEDGPAVVVLTHAFWQGRFGGDPGIVGKTVTLNRRPREVVGVLPEGLTFPDATVDFYVPLQLEANPSNRQSHYLSVVGRRAPGVSLAAAAEELEIMMAGWEAEYPDIHTGHFLFVEDYRDAMVRTIRPALLLLAGAVAFVLLIACANVANLMLVRGHTRVGEVALRRALGASRWRVARLGLVESLVLAVVGGSLGLVLAWLAVPGLLALDSGALPSVAEVVVDLPVLLFTAALAVSTALVFGLAPVLLSLGSTTAASLREEGGRGSGGRRSRGRDLLMAGEVAVSFILVIGAGLMVRSLSKLLNQDPGFETSHRMVADFSLPSVAYPNPGDGKDFLDQIVADAEALPSVSAVTHISHLPMRGGQSVNDFELEGMVEPGPGQPAWNAGVAAVRENYFDAMGIPVLEGRGFDPAIDRTDGEPVAIVSRGLADRFFGGQDPIGRRMRFSGTGDLPWWTIVGVVDDVQSAALGDEGSPVYYILTEQLPLYGVGFGYERFGTLVVETTRDGPVFAAESLRRAVAEADPQVPLTNVASLESVVRDSVARTRFVMTLMGLFAALALVLGAVGIYGVTSFVVSQRNGEIGIRKAMGAAAGEVMSLVLRQGLTTVAVGMLVGIVGALSTGKLLETLLFGITPVDVTTYVGVLALLGLVAVAALWGPARRASRVEPMAALRRE